MGLIGVRPWSGWNKISVFELLFGMSVFGQRKCRASVLPRSDGRPESGRGTSGICPGRTKLMLRSSLWGHCDRKRWSRWKGLRPNL